jgi:hypothetical protein
MHSHIQSLTTGTVWYDSAVGVPIWSMQRSKATLTRPSNFNLRGEDELRSTIALFSYKNARFHVHIVCPQNSGCKIEM